MERERPQDLTPVTVSFTLACLSVYLEVLTAHRADTWAGGSLAEWACVALGLVCYTLVFAVLSATLIRLLRPVLGKRMAPGPLTVICGGAIAVCAWGILGHLTQVGHAKTLAVMLGVAGVSALLLGLSIVAQISRRGLCIVAASTALAGMGATASAAHCYALSPDRAWAVTLGATAWMLCSILGLAATWAWTRSTQRPWIGRLGTVFLVIMLPMAAIAVSRNISAPTPDGRSLKPNLVLITCDSLRADYCSPYGGQVPTPNLQALAERGVLFTRVYSVAPWTTPAMNALFTSAHQPSLTPGAPRDQWLDEMGLYWLDPGCRTLAEVLSEERLYATAGYSGNPLLRHRDGIMRGFKDSIAYHHFDRERRGALRYVPFLQAALGRLVPKRLLERPIDTSRLLTFRAETFLRRNRHGGFFLWVHYMDPHSPYDPPQRYRTETGPWPLFCSELPDWGSPQWNEEGRLDMPPEHRPFVRALYEGEIQYVDECIGRVIDELDRLGLRDDTYIGVTADHGEEMWDHGRCGHGFALYEEQLHIPLIIAGPGLVQRVVTTPVSSIDLTPTFADLLNCAPFAHWSGVSLAPVLRNEEPTALLRPCYAQSTNHYCLPEPLRMVLTNSAAKLIQGMDSGTAALYDLRENPAEQHDLHAVKPGLAAKLARQLDEWALSFPSTFEQTTHPPESRVEEVLERLNAIGYIHD